MVAIGFGFAQGFRHEKKRWDEFEGEVTKQRMEELNRLTLNARLAQEQIAAERQKRSQDAARFREKLAHAK